ncbi:MAG: T9SS type A sorting domain-containing protein [Bacteroidales bacterium]|nr:T9SS type A sorting domain-containing protein [Bacteroidales bacterium]
MKILRKSVTLAIACVAMMGAWAQDSTPTHFIVWKADGEPIAYSLGNRPRVVPAQDKVTIVDGGVEVEFDCADIHKYTLGTASSEGIAAVVAQDGTISRADGVLTMSGFRREAAYAVYTISGIERAAGRLDANGCGQINLRHFPTGIYIITVDNQTIKFTIR